MSFQVSSLSPRRWLKRKRPSRRPALGERTEWLSLVFLFVAYTNLLEIADGFVPYHLCPPQLVLHRLPSRERYSMPLAMATPRSPKKGGGKNKANHHNTKKNKQDKRQSKTGKVNFPVASAGNSNNKRPSKKQSTSATGPRPPPWQVLSQKDAKNNVFKERKRLSPDEQLVDDTMEADDNMKVSKAFLSHADKSLLSWKRFNPSTIPSGMRYVASTLNKQLPPRLGVPEVAFLGRSNVGKSSLLNRLASFSKKEQGFNDEARVGKTPGATASVNLYAFYDKKEKPLLGFVDLPGFGYAKLSKDVKESVQQAAERYLGKRKELVLGILLIDIRRVPSEDDRIVLAALYDMGVPIVVVATKIDKVSKLEREKQLTTICTGLGLPAGQPFFVSSVTGEGTKALWNIVLEACETGVEELRKTLDVTASDDSLSVEGDPQRIEEYYNDEESIYAQGYDWIQGDIIYEGENDEDYDDDLELISFEDEEGGKIYDDLAPKKESIKDLKKMARDMERRKNV